MKALRLLLVNLLVLVALLAVCAGAGELVLRAAARPNDVARMREGKKPRFNPYVPDGVLGYALRPDWHTVHLTSEYEVTVRTNGLGLRGAPASAEKPAGVYRVLVLGDSFAFGFGVRTRRPFPPSSSARSRRRPAARASRC